MIFYMYTSSDPNEKPSFPWYKDFGPVVELGTFVMPEIRGKTGIDYFSFGAPILGKFVQVAVNGVDVFPQSLHSELFYVPVRPESDTTPLCWVSPGDLVSFSITATEVQSRTYAGSRCGT